MTLKSDAKFKEKLTCGFKYDIKDLVNFPKYIRSELKKIQRGYLSWHWTVMQKLNKRCDLGVSKMTFEELGWVSLEDSKVWKIVHWWALLSKKYNFSVKTFQRNYVSWHWKLMQILKENWHVAWKIT